MPSSSMQFDGLRLDPLCFVGYIMSTDASGVGVGMFGAGVGVGMLRGGGDSPPFQDYPRFTNIPRY